MSNSNIEKGSFKKDTENEEDLEKKDIKFREDFKDELTANLKKISIPSVQNTGVKDNSENADKNGETEPFLGHTLNLENAALKLEEAKKNNNKDLISYYKNKIKEFEEKNKPIRRAKQNKKNIAKKIWESPELTADKAENRPANYWPDDAIDDSFKQHGKENAKIIDEEQEDKSGTIQEAVPAEEAKKEIKLDWIKKWEPLASESNIQPKEDLGEKIEKQELEEERLLNEKRNSYIEAYHNYLRETPKSQRAKNEKELPGDLLWLKSEYEEARVIYRKELLNNKENELKNKNLNTDDIKKELDAYQKEELFKKLIIDENDFLVMAKAELYPPKEKSILRRGMEAWAKIPRPARWAISAGIATGFALSGGLVAGGSAALMFGGVRFGRAALSSVMVMGTERLATLGIKVWEAKIGKEKTREARIDKLRSGDLLLANLEKISLEYQKIIEETAKRQKRQNIAKWVLAAGVGGGFMMLGGEIDKALGFGKPAVPQETPLKSPEQFYDARDLLAQEKASASARADIILQWKEAQKHLEELVTVKKGEGAWHAVYRQLQDRLHQNPSKFGLNPEDLQDTAKIKDVLNKQTLKVLKENAVELDGNVKPIIGADGAEIRIAKPGVRVILDADNKVKLEGSGKLAYEWTKPKIEQLQQTGVSSEDIEKLTEQDIGDLTPEQIKEIGEYQKKVDYLKSKGVSQEDINSLTEKDIKDLTPEQLKDIADQNMQENADIETKSGWGNQKVEYIDESYKDTSLAPLKMIENTEFGIKGVFKYDANGKITEVLIDGKTPGLWDAKTLLNDNWRSLLIEKGFSGMHANVIENRAGTILSYQRIINTLENVGNGGGEEVKYLKNNIQHIIKNTEAMYGDVFKE